MVSDFTSGHKEINDFMKMDLISYVFGKKLDLTAEITNKWYPNDILVSEYNKSTKRISLIPSSRWKLNEYSIKLTDWEQSVIKIKTNQKITEDEKLYQTTELNKDILDLKSEIAKHKEIISQKSQDKDIENINAYKSYTNKAADFINNNNLNYMFKPSDILDTPHLFGMIKHYIDMCYYSDNTKEGVKHLLKLSIYFDLSDIQYNARGKFLVEYTKYKKQILKDKNEVLLLDSWGTINPYE
jgi:uncharacterized small protein (DUF1192 family)